MKQRKFALIVFSKAIILIKIEKNHFCENLFMIWKGNFFSLLKMTTKSFLSSTYNEKYRPFICDPFIILVYSNLLWSALKYKTQQKKCSSCFVLHGVSQVQLIIETHVLKFKMFALFHCYDIIKGILNFIFVIEFLELLHYCFYWK